MAAFWLVRSLFLQGDDGIREGHGTGGQTCALPISHGAVGGLGGEIVTVRTVDALAEAIARPAPTVVLVEGTIAVAPFGTNLPEIGRAPCREHEQERAEASTADVTASAPDTGAS